MIPQSFIQDLLGRVDIVDVIERHLPLKKGGANYFACCPFHGEKSASFSVSPTKQFYHCFGCGVHGNAIGFLMEYSGLSFVEAVKELAGQVGLKLPEDTKGTAPAPKPPGNDSLYAAMTAAAQFYRDQLKKTPAAIHYLKQRGLTGEIAARFGIGYAPDDWQGLKAVFADYDHKSLLECGLVLENDQGRRYDRFRHRVMFPIQDRRGRIIGFGGRVLDGGEPKYLNSPETPLFEKGRELYGLTQAHKAIRDEGSAVVVEGYMDVVALAQFGIGNTVATLGTATNAHHATTLMRLTDRVVFCFDGDAAGRRAAWRALEASLEALRDDVTLAFLFLPAEHDPDSFVRQHGAQAFRAAAANASPLARFLLDELTAKVDLETAEGRARLIHDARPLVTRVAAPLLRLQLLKATADAGGISQREIETAYGLAPPPTERAHDTWRKPRQRPGPQRPRGRSRAVAPTGILLRLVLDNPSLAARLPADLIEPADAESLALIAIIDAMSIGDIEADCGVAALVERFRETPHGTALSKVAGELVDTEFDESVVELLFEDTLRKLQADSIDHEIVELTRRERDSGLTSAERHHLAHLILQKRQLGEPRKS
ncbi:MAG TPA: DNA primase [Rhodocyclaceae bacterium]|nr:DNA primase [Rhodocyclaceae bacterium]